MALSCNNEKLQGHNLLWGSWPRKRRCMSAFGVKSPLMKAVITQNQNFHYSLTSDIYNYLQDVFKNDPMKHCFLLSHQEINHYQIMNLCFQLTVVKKCIWLLITQMVQSSQRWLCALLNSVLMVNLLHA